MVFRVELAVSRCEGVTVGSPAKIFAVISQENERNERNDNAAGCSGYNVARPSNMFLLVVFKLYTCLS